MEFFKTVILFSYFIFYIGFYLFFVSVGCYFFLSFFFPRIYAWFFRFCKISRIANGAKFWLTCLILRGLLQRRLYLFSLFYRVNLLVSCFCVFNCWCHSSLEVWKKSHVRLKLRHFNQYKYHWIKKIWVQTPNMAVIVLWYYKYCDTISTLIL